MEHTNHCRTNKRNFCADVDGHKIAALFVDLDGTILKCKIYFDEAIADFGYFMKKRGFNEQEAIHVLHEVDREFAEASGFERDTFGKSLVEAYDRVRKQSRKRFRKEDILRDRSICANIGRGPFFREPELFPNAAPVLVRAWHNFMLLAVTMGNHEAQKYKIRQAGLKSVFDDVLITSQDDKAVLVAEVIKSLNIDPKLSAFIGNSPRSDGACLAATNFIYLPLEGGWSFDTKVALPENTGFEVMHAKDWRQAEERGIKSLVRRRHHALGLQSGSSEKLPCRHCGRDKS